jgi:hypothetical protein
MGGIPTVFQAAMATVRAVVQSNSRFGRCAAEIPAWAWIVAGVAALGLVSVIFLLTADGGSSSAQDSQYSQHPEDIKIVSCKETGGSAIAELRATNSSEDQSTYALEISFQAPAGSTVYDTETLIIPQLDAHATSDLQTVRSSGAVGTKPVSCVVSRAARYGT